MRQWEGGGLLPLGDGMCVCVCGYGSVGTAIDSRVWFSRQPVPTQGLRQTRRERRAADRQSSNRHIQTYVLNTF